VGALLFVVSRQLRGEKPELESSVSELTEERLPANETFQESPEPSEPAAKQAPPVNPLGDPELVAGVLKQWLGESRQTASNQDEN